MTGLHVCNKPTPEYNPVFLWPVAEWTSGSTPPGWRLGQRRAVMHQLALPVSVLIRRRWGTWLPGSQQRRTNQTLLVSCSGVSGPITPAWECGGVSNAQQGIAHRITTAVMWSEQVTQDNTHTSWAINVPFLLGKVHHRRCCSKMSLGAFSLCPILVMSHC